MQKNKTIQVVADDFQGQALDKDQATMLAAHVANLSSAVRAAAERMDSSDQPALFEYLLHKLRRPQGK